MSHSMDREKLVETLLNTLEAERYLRAPLLATIVDELTNEEGFESAADAASTLLERLEEGALVEAEFARRIGDLRDIVHAVLNTLAGPADLVPGEPLAPLASAPAPARSGPRRSASAA